MLLLRSRNFNHECADVFVFGVYGWGLRAAWALRTSYPVKLKRAMALLSCKLRVWGYGLRGSCS